MARTHAQMSPDGMRDRMASCSSLTTVLLWKSAAVMATEKACAMELQKRVALT